MRSIYLTTTVILHPLHFDSSCILTWERRIAVDVFESDGDPVIFGGF